MLFHQVVEVFIAPQIVNSPSDLTAKLYNPGRLICESSGVPTPLTKWYKDGRNFTYLNANPSELVFASIDISDRGIYYCEVSNNNNGKRHFDKSKEVIVNVESKHLTWYNVDVVNVVIK